MQYVAVRGLIRQPSLVNPRLSRLHQTHRPDSCALGLMDTMPIMTITGPDSCAPGLMDTMPIMTICGVTLVSTVADIVMANGTSGITDQSQQTLQELPGGLCPLKIGPLPLQLLHQIKLHLARSAAPKGSALVLYTCRPLPAVTVSVDARKQGCIQYSIYLKNGRARRQAPQPCASHPPAQI